MRACLCINIFFHILLPYTSRLRASASRTLERNARRTRCKLLGDGHLGITSAINKYLIYEIREWKHHNHEKWDAWMNTSFSHSVFPILCSLNYSNKIKQHKILCWIKNVSFKVRIYNVYFIMRNRKCFIVGVYNVDFNANNDLKG